MPQDNNSIQPKNESFFQRLTRIFRSQPSVRRRVKGYDYSSFYNSKMVQGSLAFRNNGPYGFGKDNSPYSSLGESGILDRLARYNDYFQMEYAPEIASALDVYSHEIVGGDDRGKSFHVFSGNPKIKAELDELFYDVMNVEFNLTPWARNLVKFGDLFLFHEVGPDVGIVSVIPIPVSELEREEGFDENDPFAVRFKWLTRGSQYLENWQVTHMRIQGNDAFLPYGHSVLESSRRVWRVLQQMEDAMLVYRIVRAPDRRVFYIDIGNVAPNDVASYMEAAKATLASTTLTEAEHGRGDMRHNPLSVLEDYYIPVRGSDGGTKIETLAGGTNATATEDIEYIQKKLFAALKIPKPYLNYDESTGSKATLAQEDVRFSRTVAAIQKVIIAELNKIAMIHLFAKGFDGEDLVNFELKLSNPSTVALQQRLEIWQTKTDVAAAMKDTGLVDETWIKKNILELTDEDINEGNKRRVEDKIREVELEAIEARERIDQQNKTVDQFDPTNYSLTGKDIEKAPAVDAQDVVVDGQVESAEELLAKVRAYDEDGEPYFVDTSSGSPLKANPVVSGRRHNRVRRMGTVGRDNLANPDFAAMLSPKSRSLKDLYDKAFLDNPFSEEITIHSQRKPFISHELKSIFSKLEMRQKQNPINRLLTEIALDDKTTKEDDSTILIENIILNDESLIEQVDDEHVNYDDVFEKED